MPQHKVELTVRIHCVLLESGFHGLEKAEADEDEDELETVEGDEVLEEGHGHPCLIDLWQVLKQFGRRGVPLSHQSHDSS